MENLLFITAQILIIGLAGGLFCFLLWGLSHLVMVRYDSYFEKQKTNIEK
jgi:hypothetical protein